MSDQPSPEARQDYNALLQFLMPFAQQMLKKHGEFYPFGAAVSTDAEVVGHATHWGDEMPGIALGRSSANWERPGSSGKGSDMSVHVAASPRAAGVLASLFQASSW